MYRVLLADDEPSVSDAMKERIDWQKYDMKVTDIVYSGKDAMDIISTDAPDVAILDIRMPGYSGLELAKYIFENRLKTRVIILSGYAEFSYAQKAIQYDVLGYCLKPVEYDEINLLLYKATQLFGDPKKLISTDEFFEAIEANNTEKLSSFLKEQNFTSDTFYIAISRGTNVSLPSSEFSFSIDNTLYGFLSASLFTEREMKDALNTPGLCGLSFYREQVDISTFRKCFYRALSMSYQSFITPGQILCDTYTNFRKIPLTSELHEAIAFGETKKVVSILEKFKESPVRDSYSISTAQQLFNLLITSDKFISGSQDYYIYNYRQLITEYESFSKMLDGLIVLISSSSESEEPKAELSNYYFLKIMKYINTYYKENITLQDIANVVNLNPNYVSQMFKKATGTNFSRYLTDLRITNAEKMLSQSDASITEVASASGFNDYFYFLKTFKKSTGMTPSEYRASKY